jgi:hypothetical protein
MSGCGTFKCARRLYEGHGTSSYRPNNPEVAAENATRFAQLQAERDAQDRAWQNSGNVSTPAPACEPRKMPSLPPAPKTAETSQTYIAHPVWPKSFQVK